MKTSWLRNIAMVVMLAMSVSMQVYAQKPNPAQQVALDALYKKQRNQIKEERAEHKKKKTE